MSVAAAAATVFAIASNPQVRQLAGNFGRAVRPVVVSAIRRARPIVRAAIRKRAVRVYNKRVPKKYRRAIKRFKAGK